MKIIINTLIGFVLIVMLGACAPAMNRVENNAYAIEVAKKPVLTLVVDLDAVSKATGQDDVIALAMKAVNSDLTLQLGDIVVNFNKQLSEQKNKYGTDITVNEQQKLQEMLIKANQQLALKQTEANTKAQDHKESLINTWREKIQPIIKTIADKKGAKVVLVKGSALIWFESTADITDEVTAALRKNPVGSLPKIPIGSGDII